MLTSPFDGPDVTYVDFTVSDDAGYAALVAKLKNHGMSKAGRYFFPASIMSIEDVTPEAAPAGRSWLQELLALFKGKGR